MIKSVLIFIGIVFISIVEWFQLSLLLLMLIVFFYDLILVRNAKKKVEKAQYKIITSGQR
jgi:hypothetical protein